MKVSLILKEYSKATIESIIAQTHIDWELFVKCSKPEGAVEDLRVQYVSEFTATGEGVIYLHPDFRLLPNALKLLIQGLEDPTVAVAYGSTKEFKYKNPNRFSTYDKHPTPEYSSEAILRMTELALVGGDPLVLLKTGVRVNVKVPVVERSFTQELIDKWEEQRNLRSRRHMKASVIIGVKTRGRYLKRVIRSLLVQDLHRDFYDVIIVDFGSQDDLKEYIELIKAKNIKFISVPDAVQYDRARAFNIGAKNSRSEILIFSEADLLFPKSALRLIRDHITANEKHLLYIPQKNLDKLVTAVVLGRTYSDYSEMLGKAQEETRPGVYGCVAVERCHFDEVGGFDEDYVGESHEVVDFTERVQQLGVEKQVSADDVRVLHLWHNEVNRSKEGYFWELYSRKRQLATPVRNINRDWGMLVEKKPNVMFMLSPQIWESGSICKHISQFLKPYYNVEMCGARSELRGKSSGKFDIVYSIDWRVPKEFHPETSKFAMGVFDYVSWTDVNSEHNVPVPRLLDRLKLFEAVSSPCRNLVNIMKEYHPNTFYTPIGVDTEVFKPLPEKRRVSQNFTVGWVGRPEREHTVEGYLEHIKPICNQLPGIDLFSAPGGEDANGYMQMLGFYNAIDVLVVFSESSGDCKSMLEAMACGIPVITTQVGGVDEIIESYANGIIIQRNEEALTEALLTLKNKPELRVKMGEMARQTVVRNWDWRDKVHYWKEFFDFLMEQK